jgi:hypothetical protein
MVMSSCGLFASVFRAFLAGLVVLVNENGIFGSFEQSPFVFTELTVPVPLAYNFDMLTTHDVTHKDPGRVQPYRVQAP